VRARPQLAAHLNLVWPGINSWVGIETGSSPFPPLQRVERHGELPGLEVNRESTSCFTDYFWSPLLGSWISHVAKASLLLLHHEELMVL